MKESKVLSIRISSDLHEDFSSLCTRNEKSKKDVLVECINLLLDAEKTESEYEEMKTQMYIDGKLVELGWHD